MTYFDEAALQGRVNVGGGQRNTLHAKKKDFLEGL